MVYVGRTAVGETQACIAHIKDTIWRNAKFLEI